MFFFYENDTTYRYYNIIDYYYGPMSILELVLSRFIVILFHFSLSRVGFYLKKDT